VKVIRHLAVNKNGELNKAQLKEFGGRFNLIEKLRIGGTGSPNIIYLGGIRVLDLLVREIEGETANYSLTITDDIGCFRIKEFNDLVVKSPHFVTNKGQFMTFFVTNTGQIA
jgi:hypothetical protein